jgi:hypothetical protein
MAAVAACTRPGAAPEPLVAPLAVPAGALEAPGLVVTLAWDAPVDLDLYVTDPRWTTVYYARRDGHLTADARCAGDRPSGRTERADWTDPPSGRYRVGVDFPDACGRRLDRVPFRVTIVRAGTRQEVQGTAVLGVRQPVVHEFDVP